jgi:hypothetical protein
MNVSYPLDPATSATPLVFGVSLAALGLLAIAGIYLRRRVLARTATGALLLVGGSWLYLHFDRPDWLRLALQDPPPRVSAASPVWVARAPGLETADIPVFAEGTPVDRCALVRIDPAHYRFTVHWDGTRSRKLEDWQRMLGAAVVINGSYFQRDGTPATPLRSGGVAIGPRAYVSRHGAFVAGERPRLLDLAGSDVNAALRPYPEAMVSYPLLVDAHGAVRARGNREWLASRSFVAADRAGRVILGSTRTGFFSLERLAQFVRERLPGIEMALNLDGGPLAGHVVETNGYHRLVNGEAETSSGGDLLRLFWQRCCGSRWRLPIVLAAIRR